MIALLLIQAVLQVVLHLLVPMRVLASTILFGLDLFVYTRQLQPLVPSLDVHDVRGQFYILTLADSIHERGDDPHFIIKYIPFILRLAYQQPHTTEDNKNDTHLCL
jgi:hypothetical protein